ncbi:MAG: hypothetical protein ACK2UW_24125 [Anaerolineales bacterium]|jgi:hypothetical protein
MTWPEPPGSELSAYLQDCMHDQERTHRQAWIQLLPQLSSRQLRQLQRELVVRLWRARLTNLRRIPAPIKLGVSYSLLVFLAIVSVPLPPEAPILVPLLIGAAGCLALCLVAGFDLVLALALQRFHTQVPPFDLGFEGADPEL